MLVPSIATIFFNAGVLEREVWERFGISFFEHPELKRLLTDFSFKGYPLRKDFPLVGFTEVFYSDTNKKLQEVAVEIMQNYRIFSRAQEWSGTITRNGGVNNYVLKVENSRFTFFDEEGCVTTRFFLETLETNLIKIRYDFGF